MALGNNDLGVTGVVRNGKMPVHIERALNEFGSGRWSGVLQSIINCHKAGANVINMSLGGGFSQVLQDYITDMARSNDRILFVAASGNGNDTSYIYLDI